MNDQPQREATADTQGAWTIEGAGEIDMSSYLCITHPEAAVHCVQPLPFEPTEIFVRLEAPRPLGGVVMDSNGRPVSAAAVEVIGDRRIDPGFLFDGVPTWEWAADSDRTRTDAAGGFLFPRLYDGEFTLRVSPPEDDDLVEVVTARSGNENLRIVLDPARMRRVVLRGRVTDTATGEPIPTFELTPTRWADGIGTGSVFERTAWPDGRFEIHGFDPGTYVLQVKADGYATWRSERRELATGVHDFGVQMQRSRSVTIRIVHDDGTPVAATLSARTPDGTPLWLTRGGQTRSTQTTIPAGGATLHDLPEERVEFVVTQSGGRVDERVVDLRDLPDDEVVLQVGNDVPPRSVFLVCLAVPEGQDVPAEIDSEAVRAKLTEGRVATVAVAAEFEFLDADGQSVATGSVRPIADGDVETDPATPGITLRRWQAMSSSAHSGWSSETPMPTPTLHGDVPGTAVRVAVTVAGYEPVTMPLAEGAGARQPQFVWLRKQ